MTDNVEAGFWIVIFILTPVIVVIGLISNFNESQQCCANYNGTAGLLGICRGLPKALEYKQIDETSYLCCYNDYDGETRRYGQVCDKFEKVKT